MSSLASGIGVTKQPEESNSALTNSRIASTGSPRADRDFRFAVSVLQRASARVYDERACEPLRTSRQRL
jgi:hypothetical protein